MFKSNGKTIKILIAIFIVIDILALGMSMSWQANYDNTHSNVGIEVSE